MSEILEMGADITKICVCRVREMIKLGYCGVLYLFIIRHSWIGFMQLGSLDCSLDLTKYSFASWGCRATTIRLGL